ncbi:hypothetical protein PLICRDRAFT_479643 [Plicaturopsis crispa FD-325 SS-3]|nr:hypothetical protein PLICRDRAFT_479643 [Plicaturopsis crispa FD-325 SS-3]
MECRHTHPHLWLLYTILYTTYVWERVHPGRLVYYRQNTSARRRIVPTLAFIRRPAWSISEPETFFSAQLVLFPPPPSAEITDATPSQDYQARVNIFPAQKPLHHVDVDRLKRPTIHSVSWYLSIYRGRLHEQYTLQVR